MVVIYICVYMIYTKDRTVLKQIGISIIIIIGITAFFWIPMLETYFSADYVVYQENGMATVESFEESGLDIKTLFYTETENEDTTHVFEIGIPVILMVCLSIFSIKKGIHKKYKIEYILFLILGILSTIITIKQFPWGFTEKIFSIIQFKWRMLLFSNFFLAIICAINIETIVKNFGYKDVLIISTICVLYVGILTPILQKNEDIQDIDNYTLGEVTENIRSTIIGMGKGEYLTVNSNENREYIINREDTAYILKGTRKN